MVLAFLHTGCDLMELMRQCLMPWLPPSLHVQAPIKKVSCLLFSSRSRPNPMKSLWTQVFLRRTQLLDCVLEELKWIQNILCLPWQFLSYDIILHFFILQTNHSLILNNLTCICNYSDNWAAMQSSTKKDKHSKAKEGCVYNLVCLVTSV